jgi:purine-binding chemotaxis protein CheW
MTPVDDVRALLEKRAERLRSPAQPLDDDSLLWVAELSAGQERFAIPLHQLRAAVPLRAVTPVPLAPPHVIGVLRFQGQAVTALSLASLLGGVGWREDPAVLLVVDPGDGRLCALDCEQTPKPVAVPLSAVEAARAHGQEAILELAVPGARPLRLLDLSLLLGRGGARRGG